MQVNTDHGHGAASSDIDEDMLNALKHYAAVRKDYRLMRYAHRAIAGDPRAVAYCADRIEMMRLTGVRIVDGQVMGKTDPLRSGLTSGVATEPVPSLDEVLDLLDVELGDHRNTKQELEHERHAREDDRLEAAALRGAADQRIADLEQRLAAAVARQADTERDTRQALAREGVAMAQLRAAESGRVQPALGRATSAVTGLSYRQVSAELDRQLDERSGEGFDDGVRPRRMLPDEIARAVELCRDMERDVEHASPVVHLADLVVDWIAATRAYEALLARGVGMAHPDRLAALRRMDELERALVRSVAR